MATKFQKPKPFSMALNRQVGAMLESFPQFRITRWRGREVTWVGDITPTASSETYRVRITYQLGMSPQVFVISPELQNGQDGADTPHTYPRKRLCLYFPEAEEWDSSMAIGKTIMPWTALWLYFYEVWLATGKWEGGGKHPEAGSSEGGRA